ncbi:MAG: TIR domain-containing protein [Deltaproteobacteria bacterium]|nr:MAG: TIR domain-containing protein [Deltaproteobacteria bacterium]
MRDLVFISYSHKDRSFFEAFHRNLGPAVSKGLLSVWSDQEIKPGHRWADDIRDALAKARLGLLLVSDHFVNSEFVVSEELRALFTSQDKGELSLFWVPIGAAMIEQVGLDRRQIAPGCDPDHPLRGMPLAKREQVVVTVCRAILDEMGRLPAMTRSDRGTLQQRVSDAVAPKYQLLGEIASGASSIVYKAKAATDDREFVIKTLVGPELESGNAPELRERADIAKKLRHPAYITMYDEFIDRDPYCVVTEFVDGFCLDRFQEVTGALMSPRRIRDVLRDLAEALAEAHDHDYLHEGLMPVNIRMERRSHRPRMSAFRFLNIGPSSGLWGTFLINRATCTYLSPEQFDGCPRSKATDQYALGLIGYELLSGHPIERVSRPADFVHRPEFFARLEDSGDWMARAPALAGVLSRMLRVDPAQRWDSMAEAAEMLERVVVEDSVEAAARRRVLASYSTFQARDRANQLYAGFYRRLFQAMPDVQRLFAGTDMARQYNALNQALKALLDFDAESPATVDAIRAVAVQHRRHGLNDRHVEAFERALLGALEDGGVSAPETLDAWRRILAPGLEQMRGALRGPEPRPVPAELHAP